MKRTVLSLASMAFVCAMTLTSCNEIMSTVDNPVSSYLAIETADMELLVGQDSLRAATTISTEKVRYASSDENVAVVDATGKVTAVAVGTATITASVPKTADGLYLAGEQQYKVNVVRVGVTFDKNEATMWTDNLPHAPREVTATHKNAVLTFSSDNPDVATVDPATGVVTPVGGGLATISVDVAYGDFYAEKSAVSYLLTVYNYIWLPKYDTDLVLHNYDQVGGYEVGKDEFVWYNHALIIDDGATVFFHQPITVHNTHANAVFCKGDATIVLQQPGVTYKFQSADNFAGLAPGPAGTTLTIKGEGNLITMGGGASAGIGSDYQESCGNIIIEGGNITASSRNQGAGIGCGALGSCGDITIKGGTIVATGAGDGSNYYGAGIGSALSGFMNGPSICGKITISGGDVTAYGAVRAAGIGSGAENGTKPSGCGDIIITGGTVKATGGKYAAGIGSGAKNWSAGSYCSNITITGGTITATMGEEAGYDVGPSAFGKIKDGCTVTVADNVKIKTNSGADAKIWKP